MNKISSLFFGKSIKSIAGARLFWAVASGWLLVSSAFAAPPATYRQWLQQYGLPADATGQGARSAMPNNDGITNMIKFSLGLAPGDQGYAGHYSVGPVTDAGLPYLALTYTCPSPSLENISYNIETSSDLTSWFAAGNVLIDTVISGSFKTITVRDSQSINGSTPKRYIRLSVTTLPPVNTVLPTITGSAVMGQTLTASSGSWTDGGETYTCTYQWTRNGVDISGATSATYRLLDLADVSATLGVRIVAANEIGSTTSSSTGTGPIATAPVPLSLSVRPDGYTADVVFAGITGTGGTYGLGTDSNPAVRLIVSSPGFDGTGAATTITREIIGTVPLRQPYPNQLINTETTLSGGVKTTIALSDRLYAADTITSCTFAAGVYTKGTVSSAASTILLNNTSTLVYPKAIANWCAVPYDRAVAGSTSFDVELLAFHRHPSNGQQVPCVEFIATDVSGNSVSVKSSTMVQSTRVTTGNPIAVYRASIPLASLAQGQLVTVRCKVYPFLGNNTAVLDSDPSVDGETGATPNLTNYVFFNDKTGGYGTVYAYVSPSGSNSTGAASNIAATAAAAPFATIYGAAAAIKAKNNTLYAHNDLGGGAIRLTAGTHSGFGTDMHSLGAGKTWLTVEAAPGEGVSSVTLMKGSAMKPGNFVKFKNIALASNTTTMNVVIDGALDANGTAGPPQIYGAYEGLRIYGPSTLSASGPCIYRVGMCYILGCDMKDIGVSLNATWSKSHVPLLAGCKISSSSSTNMSHPVWASVGNQLSNNNTFSQVVAANGIIFPTRTILAFNSSKSCTVSTAFAQGTTQAITGGLAVVQNVFEQLLNTPPCFQVGADSATVPVNNVVIQHISAVGNRTNFLYNDLSPSPISKNGSLIYSILYNYNCKTDTFLSPTAGRNGLRTGNWETVHGVGITGNLYQSAGITSAAAPLYTDPDSWNGMYKGRYVVVGSASLGTAANLAMAVASAAFVNEQGNSVGGLGNGDYHIGATSQARNLVPAGCATLPFDLDGQPRRNDGTGAAGAYEYIP